MRIQVLFQVLVAGVTASMGVAQAACFDFSARVGKPLADPVALSDKGDASEKGKRDDGVTWAKVRGRVDKPVLTLYGRLLDHETTKSPRVEQMDVERVQSPVFLSLHKVKMLIKPFLFVKIRWTEMWAYELIKGGPATPEEMVISYEKIEGTSHIEHLCGNIVLRKLSDGLADVYLYEEAKATRRSAEDTLHGLEGTLRALRHSSQ